VKLILPPGFNFDLKYYISGPMTGYPSYNYPYFEAVAAAFEQKGIEHTSPHRVEVAAEDPTWHHYMRANVKSIMDCEGLVLLRGWPESSGARMELEICLTLEMPVYYLNNETLIKMSKDY